MIVYKITNKLNHKIYVGVTSKSADVRLCQHKYSPHVIGHAIRKYGIQNFPIEILHNDLDTDNAFLVESQIVTQDFIERDDTYNMVLGGLGCIGPHMFSDIRNQKISEAHKKRFADGLASHKSELNPRYGDHRSYEEIYGKDRAEQLRKEQSESRKGSGNSRACTWTLVSPNGEVFKLNGNCKQFCLDNNLSMRLLKKHMPNPVQSDSPRLTDQGRNTLGWALSKD